MMTFSEFRFLNGKCILASAGNLHLKIFFGKIISINFILNAKFQVHNFRKSKQFHDEVFPDMVALNFHMERSLLWRFCSDIFCLF